MPVDRIDCSECGTTETICPECESRRVTALENMAMPEPNNVVLYGEKFVPLDYCSEGEEEEYEFYHVCWSCGWEETVTVSIERQS